MALRMFEMVLPEDVGHYAHDYLREQGIRGRTKLH